jgi:hypothetical protein
MGESLKVHCHARIIGGSARGAQASVLTTQTCSRP